MLVELSHLMVEFGMEILDLVIFVSISCSCMAFLRFVIPLVTLVTPFGWLNLLTFYRSLFMSLLLLRMSFMSIELTYFGMCFGVSFYP